MKRVVSWRMAVALPALALTVAACATAGSTFRSGVGARMLDRPPYRAGAVPMPQGRIAHLPISYQRGGAQAEMFDPSDAPDSPVAALLAEMNAYLDSLSATVPLGPPAPVAGTPPDVRFGCEADHFDECAAEGDGSTAQGPPWMRLEVARPSARWIESVAREVHAAGADRVLVVTLEVGQYWPDQTNWRGDKVVRLGTGYAVDVPWLTALDRPVQVLQLTGALMDPDGRARAIAAEGLMARRTNLLLGSFGVQELISEEDVARIRSAQREDLPAQPRVWEVALRNLVAELTAEPELRVR